ncbi:aldo/keto reductase [Actinomycetospora termitidis]|uniref:Aldo/keto reductase n=1 Tax=Actinomycetospora termitidis TaxID=3053470 RepID=A0ABT7MIX6_9PSEU|nr:aldo/keto reductase [Actinomycetospora sp. Odt1-22]MDL5160576.1 aldo/keto reductase [Actinomycetospora sp. Odt1-22]
MSNGPTDPATRVVLNNGVLMPQLGFGVSEARDAEASVTEALARGYRSVDTAAVYGNEDGVGAALAAFGLPREDLFVTTKVWNGTAGCRHALDCAQQSLDRLGLDYVDLYLVHWPTDQLAECVATWDAMEQLLAEGRTRAIGVSNFRHGHLERVLELGGTVPAVNQIELHPHLQQHELRALHAEHGIQTEAWSPLGRGAVLHEPALGAIAARLGRTTSQVVLRWHLQEGRIVIPKSDTPERIAGNRAVFDFALSDADMDAIAALHVPDGAGRIGPVPEDPRLAVAAG